MPASRRGFDTPALKMESPITDFVEDMPLPASHALQLLPRTLRTLHALPPFPKEFNYITAHNYFIWKFRNASLLPQNEIDDAFASYDTDLRRIPASRCRHGVVPHGSQAG